MTATFAVIGFLSAYQSRRRQSPLHEVASCWSVQSWASAACKDECPSKEEAEQAARDLTEAAIASASAFAADARAVDPASYVGKPTAFLYRGHTAQIATSTAGMYGEMIESFIKQVTSHFSGEHRSTHICFCCF